MANSRDIKRRIVGVKNTGKITRAMEMISAVKMRKASAAVFAIRPYAESATLVLRQLAQAVAGESHPLLTERPVKRELYIVFSSNRGLCGAFNAQLTKKIR
jgi:F-type H+-transporting ATPase subunit gamma